MFTSSPALGEFSVHLCISVTITGTELGTELFRPFNLHVFNLRAPRGSILVFTDLFPHREGMMPSPGFLILPAGCHEQLIIN